MKGEWEFEDPEGGSIVDEDQVPVVHSVTHPLEHLLSTQGLGKDLKTHWLVDSGATCHIVAEEWLKLYKVKYWYTRFSSNPERCRGSYSSHCDGRP